jgi:hypothetical protein
MVHAHTDFGAKIMILGIEGLISLFLTSIFVIISTKFPIDRQLVKFRSS